VINNLLVKAVCRKETIEGFFMIEKELTDNGAPEHYYREYHIEIPYIHDGFKTHLIDDMATLKRFTGEYTRNEKDLDQKLDKIWEGDKVKLHTPVLPDPEFLDFEGIVIWSNGAWCVVNHKKEIVIELWQECCWWELVKC